jgi:phosphatidylglycerophosphate synthase
MTRRRPRPSPLVRNVLPKEPSPPVPLREPKRPKDPPPRPGARTPRCAQDDIPRARPPGQGLYGVKPALQRRLGRLADHLARRGVDPDRLTLAAIPCALTAAVAGAVAARADQPALLAAVPPLAAARIVLNALDGMVAARRGVGRPWGGYLNDMCDRLTDILFLAGLLFLPGLDQRLTAAAMIATLVASYAGALAASHGGPRLRGGVMAKADRMLWLSVGAGAAALSGSWAPLRWAAALLLVGAVATIVQRARAAPAAL